MSPGSDEALRAEDAHARALAQREFRTPLVLEAGAGTGKTATLVARVVVWCLGPGWERAAAALGEGAAPAAVAARTLSRVVAITFTEAAAAEMATRVEKALADLEAGAAVTGIDADALPTEPAPRAAALRDALDHLVVQTLHAFARRLLVAHPFESGVHPRLEVDADGRARAEAVRDVLEARLGPAYEAREEDLLDLARAGQGPAQLEQALLALLEQGVEADDLARDPLAPEEARALLSRARAALDAVLAAAGTRLFDLPRAKKAQAVLSEMASLRDACAGDGASLVLERARAGAAALCASSDAKLREWAGGGGSATEKAALGDAHDDLSRATAALLPLLQHLAEIDPPRLAATWRVLRSWLAEAEEGMRRQGVSGFGPLLTGAASLLRRRPDVASRLRRGIDQLLVDEFQDTDPHQCAIVAALALEGPEAERPGLFIVGDPKQSIYGWRSADLAAYEAFVARVRAQGGVVHPLRVNHRSFPAVLEEVERVVAPVMRATPGVQPPFEPLLPSADHRDERHPEHPRFAGVEHWVVAPWSEAGPVAAGATHAARVEARALADDLVVLRASGVAWREMGLLFRSRGEWDVYLGALREAGVPFAVEGDRSYYRRREIIDAAAFLRCVLDPLDQPALVAFLRSSMVGVPDAAWLPLWSRGLPRRLAALARADDPDVGALARDAADVARALRDDPGVARVQGWERAFAAAVRALATLRGAYEDDPGDVFVERLRASLAFEAGEAARALGSWRVANLERFFRDVAEQLADGTPRGELLRRLRNAVAEEERMEEEPPHDTSLDAVQVMTLHGAKGLGFAHVYLVQLHKGRGQPQAGQVEADRVDGRLELRVLDTPSLGFDRVRARREQVAEAEAVRLLYVGMTRAKQRLVLSGLWPAWTKRGGKGSHVRHLEQRRELPDLAALARQAAAEGRDAVDEGGARFVFPARRAREAPAVRASGAAAVDAWLADAAADARRLADAAVGARARMARRLDGRASDAGLAEWLDVQAARAVGEPPPAGAFPASRPARDAEAARLAGIAAHLVLERLDLSRPVEEALDGVLPRVEGWMRAQTDDASAARAAADAHALFDALRGGALLARLEAWRPHVVARELPVLLPAPPGEDGPVAYLAGSIDLLARDPRTGALVVVDYKTDAVPDDAALAARRDEHAAQGAVYQRALREGLGLPADPRFELWFLAADRCVGAAEPPGRDAPQQLPLTLGGGGE